MVVVSGHVRGLSLRGDVKYPILDGFDSKERAFCLQVSSGRAVP